MSLKIKIAARLKAKAAGVNLSQKRIDVIVARAEKGGLTDESDDTAIDAQLDIINELTPFTELASFDDHQRAKGKKIADDKETARLKAIADGKPEPVEIDPNESKTDKMLRLLMEKLDKQDEAIASMKGEKVANTQRERYIESMKGTPAVYQAKELKRFDRMKFDRPEDFDSFLEDTKDDHAGAIQDESNNGLGADRPAGGAGGAASTKGEASQAEIDAAFPNFKL